MTKLVILGAGGHAREIADVVDACRAEGATLELVGYLDDDPDKHGTRVGARPVLGGVDWLGSEAAAGVRVVSGVGSPAGRRRAVAAAEGHGARFETLVHPRATLTPHVRLATGVVVTAGCVLTNNIEIGAHTHLNRLVTVGHDCVVGAFVHLAPGAVLSGNVRVGDGCDIGTNACVIQNVTIGPSTIVGAGAAVIADLPGGVTAVGVPARVLTR